MCGRDGVVRRADLEPGGCEIPRSSGRKPRTGRQRDPTPAHSCTGKPPRVPRIGFDATKTAGGSGVKALRRCVRGTPEGGTSPGGARIRWSFTASSNTALIAGSKALKSTWGSLARVKPQAGFTNGTRAWSRGNPVLLREEGETPEGANPGRGSGVKQTRKAGGGVNRRGRAKRRGRTEAWGWDPARVWMPPVDVAMRAQNPKGGARTRAVFGGRKVSGGGAGAGRQQAAVL